MDRTRVVILSCVASLTILAWAYLVYLDRQMSAAAADANMMAAMGMAMDAPWTVADVLFTFAMWAVMMIGMMAPSVTPVLLLAAKAPAAKRATRQTTLPLYFGAGYGLVWIGFSGAAALAQWALHEAALLSPAMTASNSRVASVILIGAGLYQLTPLKQACLTHCRSPLDFLMGHWRNGLGGAFRMGLHHGAHCLGCCWALMAVLFVVGVMNLVWVAALAVFVLIEKVAPASAIVSRIAGVALIVFGLIRLVSPA